MEIDYLSNHVLIKNLKINCIENGMKSNTHLLCMHVCAVCFVKTYTAAFMHSILRKVG